MDTLIKADIFFFVSTIAVVVLTVLLAICLIHLSRALRNFRDISDALKRGVENASDHLEDLCDRVERSFVFRLLFGRRRDDVHDNGGQTRRRRMDS